MHWCAKCHVGCQRGGRNICQSLEPWQMMTTADEEALHIESYDTRQEWPTVSCMQKFHKATIDHSLSHLSPLQTNIRGVECLKRKPDGIHMGRGYCYIPYIYLHTYIYYISIPYIYIHIYHIYISNRAEVDIYICCTSYISTYIYLLYIYTIYIYIHIYHIYISNRAEVDIYICHRPLGWW